MGMVGVLPHMNRPAGITFQCSGRTLVLIGGLLPGGDDQLERRFGSSQYAKEVAKQVWGLPPALDLDFEIAVQATVRKIVTDGLAESVHDVSDGGLAVAVVESCFAAKRLGAEISLETAAPLAAVLFHEAPSRILLSIKGSKLNDVERAAQEHGVPAVVIGQTTDAPRISFRVNDKPLFEVSTDSLFEGWDKALVRMLNK
jgi:phosphoribosylformylglycinamidine synthase